MTYVLNSKGEPLMPCNRRGKIRHLLRDGKAFIVSYNPFTIQLTKERKNEVHEVTLGVDPGYNNIGLSVTTEKEVLFEANVDIENNIKSHLSTKRELRRNRRYRKTRSRKARFKNRKHEKGWLPPSIKARIEHHVNIIARLYKFLPIGKIIVEIAKFDIQKIKNPSIKGAEYQHGEQYGFSNVREYVLARDGHICRCCKGASKDVILQVHHIESRKTGSNAPNNLITLCKTCHENFHNGLISLDGVTKGNSYKAETFMGLVRNYLYKRLKEIYGNVGYTYGYITKAVRIENHLEKDHYIDARCISGNPLANPNNEVYRIKKVRSHNRQLHLAKYDKKGVRKNRKSPYEVHGFRLYDKVEFMYKGELKRGFVTSRKTKDNTITVKDIDGKKICEITYKKVKLIDRRKSYVFEKSDVNHKLFSISL